MRKLSLLAVLLILAGSIVTGCAQGDISQGSAMDRQKEIEEGNKKLGVEGTQE
jgi:hypothetical protein